MTRAPILRAFLGVGEIHVDLFAGGGGASLGVSNATGRAPDVAINHSAKAIAMHRRNHPTTRHFIENVFKVDPRRAAEGRSVGLLWMSPDCTQFSHAKGGKPCNQKIRCLCWSVFPWIKHAKPRVVILENVAEFLDYGPLHQSHIEGCKLVPEKRQPRGKRKKPGPLRQVLVCSKAKCHYHRPIKARKGETFRAFTRKLRSKGYVVEWRTLRACDYGAPTSRKRLFLIARCDGVAISWPAPTHGKIKFGSSGDVKPHRTAAECIDWNIPCPSIFDRKEPLSPKTEARIVAVYVRPPARCSPLTLINRMPAARGVVDQADGHVCMPPGYERIPSSILRRIDKGPTRYEQLEMLSVILAELARVAGRF